MQEILEKQTSLFSLVRLTKYSHVNLCERSPGGDSLFAPVPCDVRQAHYLRAHKMLSKVPLPTY